MRYLGWTPTGSGYGEGIFNYGEKITDLSLWFFNLFYHHDELYTIFLLLLQTNKQKTQFLQLYIDQSLSTSKACLIDNSK